MSQTSQILTHLKRQTITPLQALDKFGCMRLAARISDLRGKGHTITTERVKSHTGSFYARYSLVA